jgi:hypothetical protein
MLSKDAIVRFDFLASNTTGDTRSTRFGHLFDLGQVYLRLYLISGQIIASNPLGANICSELAGGNALG